MDRYASDLLTALNGRPGRGYQYSEFIPRFPSVSWMSNSWRERFARYVSYPRQASRVDGDIFHIVDHGYAHLLAALDPKRCVVTVHDVIPLLVHRGELNDPRSNRRRFLSEYSARFLRAASHLIAVSESTRSDLIRLLDVNPDRVKVVHNGLSETFAPLKTGASQLRRRFALPESDYLILITGRQFYKNHKTSIRVLKQLHLQGHPAVSLVLLGELDQSDANFAIQEGVRDRIRIVRASDDEELRALYCSVDCLLFPSVYEGFGWPPLEAMACGTPVVASNRASIPEVVRGAALTSDPFDVLGLSELIRRLMTEDNLRRTLVEQGGRRAVSFRWKESALAIQNIYENTRSEI